MQLFSRQPRLRQLQRLGHPLLQRLQRRQEGVLRAAHARVRRSPTSRTSPTPTRRPTRYRLITPPANRVSWPGPGAHSAVKLWNKNWVYVSDEVYGTITGTGHGCPWGWARFVDVADETRPVVRSEFRLPENQPLACTAFNPPRTSYSAHNPTLTPSIAFSTWHSGGFQAIDITNPASPTQLAEFKPDAAADGLRRGPAALLRHDRRPHRQQGRDVELPGHPGRPDLHGRPAQRPLHPQVQRPVLSRRSTTSASWRATPTRATRCASSRSRARCPVDCSATPTPRAARAARCRPRSSLTLGAPATFGAFTPGVAKDYTAPRPPT